MREQNCAFPIKAAFSSRALHCALFLFFFILAALTPDAALTQKSLWFHRSARG
jgi:hypothetical protein